MDLYGKNIGDKELIALDEWMHSPDGKPFWDLLERQKDNAKDIGMAILHNDEESHNARVRYHYIGWLFDLIKDIRDQAKLASPK